MKCKINLQIQFPSKFPLPFQVLPEWASYRDQIAARLGVDKPKLGRSKSTWAMKKGPPGWLFDIRDEILPNYVGNINISQYKDPY